MSKITIYNATIGKYVTARTTGRLHAGQTISELEFLVTKNCACTIDREKNIATDIYNNEKYPLLKRDTEGLYVEDQNIDIDKEYVMFAHESDIIKNRKLKKLRRQYKNNLTV